MAWHETTVGQDEARRPAAGRNGRLGTPMTSASAHRRGLLPDTIIYAGRLLAIFTRPLTG